MIHIGSFEIKTEIFVLIVSLLLMSIQLLLCFKAKRLWVRLIPFGLFAGDAVKILAAFTEKPVRSNFYEVFELEKMSNLIPRLAVKTAILCVPHKEAAYVAEQLIKCGINRILNWSGEFLTTKTNTAILNEEPPSVNVEN